MSLLVEKKGVSRIFRHRVQEGASKLFADDYGIYIAEKAAVPQDILDMARTAATKIRKNKARAKQCSGNLQNQAYYRLVQELKNLASSSLHLDGKRKYTPRCFLLFVHVIITYSTILQVHFELTENVLRKQCYM
jgi:DNA mismatch repair ATPase MutS